MTHDWRERLLQAFPGSTQFTTGDAASFDFAISEINLLSGGTIELQRPGVTAIVGANNAGKSTILREVFEKLGHQEHTAETPKVSVSSVNMELSGDAADAIAWVGDNANFVVQGNQAGFMRENTGTVHPEMLARAWKSSIQTLGKLGSFVVFYGNAQARFNVGGSTEMRESVDDPPQHPVHYLQDSPHLLERISRVSGDVFGSRLTLDPLGRTLRLRVGELKSDVPRLNEITPEFRAEMASLRTLDDQGDGMRSLMGQLLPVVTGAYRFIIIDEPEAFLHPPQAHALGVELGRLAIQNGVQILIATHDRALLTGLLDSQVDVAVVRLAREDGPPNAQRLDAEQLRELWSDPVLKYTNVLDGLFHRLVVVAEAEGDCAFLQAAMDCEGRSASPMPRNEMLFVPTGGKDGMAKVCSALTAVGVPVVVAPDLDMLSDQAKLRKLVESVGATWTEDMQDNWGIATDSMRKAKEPAKVGHVLDAIAAALSDKRDDAYSYVIKEEVLAQLRTSGSPWGAVKEHGVGAFKGKEFTALKQLLDLLDNIGIVLVKPGELERLAPEVEARKGSGWLPSALSQSAQCNAATQEHVDRILESGQKQMANQLRVSA